MNKKDELYLTIKKYCEGNYTIDAFDSLFRVQYDLEMDFSLLTDVERDLLSGLSDVLSRYSPFESDHDLWQGYTTEEEVRNEANKVYLKLTKE